MRVSKICADCLWDKQKNLSDDPAFLQEIRDIIDNRQEDDSSPYLVHLFGEVYERHFGIAKPYAGVKRKYNDFALSMEEQIRKKIEASDDPLGTAFSYARIGNYIDFGAMEEVSEDVFLSLLDEARLQERDMQTMASFISCCEQAGTFLLLADNAGEIVLDKLFLEQVQKRFPQLEISVMVRGKEVLNDATEEDAVYTGIGQLARIVSNGGNVAGTVYEMLPDEAKAVLDTADVILAKGQGNYESLSGSGRHVFYSLLCKCGLFTDRFNVPLLTGVFAEEAG